MPLTEKEYQEILDKINNPSKYKLPRRGNDIIIDDVLREYLENTHKIDTFYRLRNGAKAYLYKISDDFLDLAVLDDRVIRCCLNGEYGFSRKDYDIVGEWKE